MNDRDLESALTARVRTMQIMVFALAMGVLAFMAVAVIMQTQGNRRSPFGAPILTYIGAAYAAAILAAYAFVPSRAVVTARRELAKKPAGADANGATSDVGALCNAYQTRLIIGAALIEGLAFYFLIAYLIEGQWPALVAAILCLVGIVAKFPTVPSFVQWLEAQRELVQYERSLQ